METKRPETEEERRERVRRARARKELHQQRIRRKKIIRLSVYVLIGILGVLLIVAVMAIVHKVRDDREEQAVENAIQEEITNSAFYDSSEVLHLSFPVLSLDSAGSGLSVSQFGLILEDLYAGGYVLIDPYELAGRTEKGFQSAQIMVPSGKKPLILSQHDVSYEEGDTAHATALTQDASGRISCTYFDEFGSQVTGAVDVVPIVESFIESHPDFSYKGARGIIGVTGYRGVLGYEVEVDEASLQTIKIDRPAEEEELYGDAMYEEDPYAAENISTEAENTSLAADSTSLTAESSADSEAERKQAEENAEKNRNTVSMLLSTLRSHGWHIASNTYSLTTYAASTEIVKEDAEKWNTVIAPLAGSTDMLMLPDGADIGEWSGYTETNERYTLLRDLGFRYFFFDNAEAKTWAQIRPAYVRQSMHEIAEYAAYVSLMDANGAVDGTSDSGETGTAGEEQQDTGFSVLQPVVAETQEEMADGSIPEGAISAEETYSGQ